MAIIGKLNEVIDMAKYTVIIEEVVSEEFEIHANTEEEAQKLQRMPITTVKLC